MKAIAFGAVVGLLLSLVFKSLPGKEYTLGKVEFQFFGFAEVVKSMQSFFTFQLQLKGQVGKCFNFYCLSSPC